MPEPIFPYMHFLYLFLIGAAIVFSMTLIPLWSRRSEQPQIPWLTALALTLGVSAWFGVKSLSIASLYPMMENMRIRQLLAYLGIILLCGLIRSYFHGKIRFLYTALPLLYAILVPYMFYNGYVVKPIGVHHTILPWGESIYILDSEPEFPTYFHYFGGMLAVILGLIMSLYQAIRHKSQKHAWLALCLVAPVITGTISVWTNTGFPVIPLSNMSVLLLLIVPVFKELAKSEELARELQLRENIIRGMALQNPGVLYSLLFRPDGTRSFLFLSERILDVLGIPASHPDPIAALKQGLSSEDQHRFQESEQLARREHKTWTFRSQYTRPDGRVIWFEGISTFFPQQNGVVSNGVILDITERTSQEQEKEKLLSEVSLRKNELETMLFTLSHDMRSPLVNIDGFGTETLLLLQDYSDNWSEAKREESIENMRILLKNSKRLSSVISLLLDVGRHSRDAFTATEVNTEKVWTDALSGFAWTEMEIEIVKNHPMQPCIADANRLKLVFQKVLDNCIAYRKPGTRSCVTVDSNTLDNKLIIAIRDNGIGLDTSQSEYCFSAFMQMNPNSDHQGMGLTLARLLLRRMGGTIRLEGAIGTGTTAIIELPTKKEHP